MDKVKLKYLTHCNVNKINNITNETINYIDIGSVSSDNKVNEIQSMPLDESPSRARRRIKTGDTIISTVRTYLKAIAYVSEEMNNYVCSTGFAVFSANNNLTSKYLYYSTLSIKFIDEISKKSVGVSYPAINSSEIGNIKICKPTLKNQELVSNFLDFQLSDIDSLISLKEKQIKLLEEQRQAMITEAVTKGLNSNVKMKNSGVDWIGEIPEHWEIKQLKYVIDVIMGQSADSKSFNIEGVGIPFLQGNADFSALFPVPRIYTTLSKKKCQSGDILLSVRAPVGAVNIANSEYSIGRGLCALRGKKGISQEYIYYSSYCFKKGLKQYLKGSTFDSVSTTDISRLFVTVPPENEQKDICIFLLKETNNYDYLLNKIVIQISKLKEYRQSLIHEAVTGKISIEEMESYLKENEEDGN